MKPALQIALVSESSNRRANLKRVLESHGASVIFETEFKEFTLESLSRSPAEILLIDLNEDSHDNVDCLDAMLADVQIPVLFNDSEIPETGPWGKRLLAKLHSLVPAPEVVEPPLPAPLPIEPVPNPVPQQINAAPAPAPKLKLKPVPAKAAFKTIPVKDDRAETIWVLGASIGGPQAVKQFMQTLPDDLPVGFVLVQHIGASFVELLANQLDKSSAPNVIAAVEGEYIKKGQLVLARARAQLSFDRRGKVKFKPVDPKWPYSPSIDAVILEVIAHYKGCVNVILFSGMGNDGVEACREVIAQGGMIWGQRQDTCVVASMIEAARRESMLSYIGTPVELAKNLLMHLGRSPDAKSDALPLSS